MAAYRRVYDSRHLQADCQEPGSASEPYAWQSSMGYLFLPFLVSGYFAAQAPLTCSGIYLAGSQLEAGAPVLGFYLIRRHTLR